MRPVGRVAELGSLGRFTMRTLIAIIAGCVGMLVAFSVLWSSFGVTQHSYGAPDRFSQILGTLAFAAVYRLPISFVLALVVVWPTERIGRRLARVSRQRGLRAVAWLLVASATYVWGAAVARRDLSALAIICGIVAAGVATFLFSRIIRTHDSATHTTA